MVKSLRQHGFRLIITAILSIVVLSACSANDNSHTTVTTVVTPPRRQELTVVTIPPIQPPSDKSPSNSAETKLIPKNAVGVDPSKPLLVVKTPGEGQTFRAEEVVLIDFLVLNAKLKGEGGEYRFRYFVDDDDPRWVDNPIPFGLSGWLPGPHRIRLELIGPDGWPYRNGNQNIVTREIKVSTQ
jgi:hypothetical protein